MTSAAVITFPGSNCDRDAIVALKKTGFKVDNIWYKETNIANNYDLIMVPGGFSYGDYLRSGAMAATSPVMKEVRRLADKGTKILGVCNGFQILQEALLLKGSLLRNKKMKFICKTANLQVVNNQTPFTAKYNPDQLIKIPVAHMDGNYFISSDGLKELQDKDNIAFKYRSDCGKFEEDLNGSTAGIAGIFNDQKNILGMMPHPERAVDSDLGLEDGIDMFIGLLN